ncbi:hypothetical protein [Sorangium sp. So ce388]|uniref:hypothetical protein n=1 Tax=Sorangium sp. So ce388 TaxID=3133309 RepID=UPI003F5BD217
MSRANFNSATKRLLAERAGHQCSFPTCDRRTIGPGAEDDEVSLSGVAAHIYSASPGGARGQSSLSDEELASPQNGIWLCADHSRLVDNNHGRRFPPETLLSYKHLQEARVAREHQGLFTPIGWLHELHIGKNPIFAPGQHVTFSKLSLLHGDNATGKTAIAEWLAGMFGGTLGRWRAPRTGEISLTLSYLNPEPIRLGFNLLEDKHLHFFLNGSVVPLNPIALRIIKPVIPRFGASDNTRIDDRRFFADVLGVDAAVVDNLVSDINSFPHAKMRNLRFQEDEPDEDEREYPHGLRLRLDLDGTAPGLPFAVLSGREQERVIVEFATATARASGRYSPTVLILDEVINILFQGWFDYYSGHFLDPSNQFQTIFCLPTLSDLDLNKAVWRGWEVIRASGKPGSVKISQQLREPRA